MNLKNKNIKIKKYSDNGILLLREIINSFEMKSEYSNLKETREKINQVDNKFYRLLLELAISLKIGNLGWSNRTVDSLLKLNVFELVVNPVFLSLSDQEMVELLEKLFTRYKKDSKREIHTQMLTNKFFHLGNNNNYKVLVNRFNSLWPLQEVREIIKKTMFAGEFFDFWYTHLLNRTSDNNLRSLMRTMLNPERIRKAAPSQLWLFRYYYPGEAELRNEIISKLINAWEGNIPADKLMVVDCLENSILKRDLAKRNNYFEKPLFQIKRDFFNNILDEDVMNEYAVYQLTLLGDTNMENLWKMLVK
jgi:hypothetical protein